MWGPGPWGPMMSGWWWIFPLLGLVMCLAFLIMMFRFMTTGRGVMCMGGHQDSGTTEVAETRRELQALREELKEVKAAR